MARTRDDTAVSWRGVSAAVALLTLRQGGSDDPQADLIGDMPPGQVIAALEIIGSVFLDALAPDGRGDRVLEFIGLAALEHGEQQAG
jgi:hypothetical protein